MSTIARAARGQFAPGTSGNRAGRPSNASRVMKLIERDLLALGATPEDVTRLTRAAADPHRAALAIAVMAAAVMERAEPNASTAGPT